jgi:tetratricopeptide (TPR) repeat protein
MHTTADNARLYLRDALEQQGRYAEAKVPVQEALANYQRQYGEHHMYTLYFSGAVWWVEAQQGGAEQAEAALREIAGALRQELGAQYLDTLEVTTWYLRVLIMRAKFADAEALARDAHSSLAASVGQETPLALDALELLSMAQRGLGKSEEAERTAREVVQAAERVFTTGYYHLPQFRNHWGRCLLDLGRYEDAEAQLLKAHAGEIAMRGPEHRNTREVVANLMRLYEAWDKPDKAAGWRTKLPTTQPGDPQR